MRVHPGMNLLQDRRSIQPLGGGGGLRAPDSLAADRTGTAAIEIPSLPGRRFRGAVRFLSPAFSGRTRTLQVSLELMDPDPSLRADMYANVTFDVSSVRGALAVPEDSVIHSGRRNLVVLDLANGAFQVREVMRWAETATVSGKSGRVCPTATRSSSRPSSSSIRRAV